MKTEMVHARIDPNIKHDAERVFKALGINTTDAIRMFLTQVILQQALPFELRIPNAQTRKAMEDSTKGVDLCTLSSIDDLDKLCNA